jgi:acyl-CoA thioester hydrolase
MQSFIKNINLRWSDLDPNFHVRHSVYYDIGATCRMEFLTVAGITPALMFQHHIGPILFREECLFRKEIRFGDQLTIDLELEKLSGDHSKWTMKHQLRKNGDTVAAIITIDGAWMDTVARKITAPPESFISAFDSIPKSAGFNQSL